MIKALRGIALGLAMLLCGQAQAHQPSFSQLEIHINAGDTQISVQMPIAAFLHEEPSVLPPDTTEGSFATNPLPGELQKALIKLIVTRLHIVAGTSPLPLTVNTATAAGGDVVFTITAPRVTGPLTVDANLFPADTLGSFAGECGILRSHERFLFSRHVKTTPPERSGQMM